MQKQNVTCDGMKEKQCFGEISEQTEYSGFNWKDEMTDRGIIFSMMDSFIGVGVVFLFLGLLMGSVPILLLAVLLMVVLPLIKDAIGKYVKAGKCAFAYREKSDASQDITEWMEQFYELFDLSSDLLVILSEDISQSKKKQMELAIPKAVDRFLELKKVHTKEGQEEVELPITFYFMAKKKTNPTILFLHDYERIVEKIY